MLHPARVNINRKREIHTIDAYRTCIYTYFKFFSLQRVESTLDSYLSSLSNKIV